MPIVPSGAPTYAFNIRANDRTVNRTHVMQNLAENANPVTSSNSFNQATQNDRFDYSRSVSFVNGVNLSALDTLDRQSLAPTTVHAAPSAPDEAPAATDAPAATTATEERDLGADPDDAQHAEDGVAHSTHAHDDDDDEKPKKGGKKFDWNEED